MSEIVYTSTEERRDHLPALEFGRTTADRKVTIFADDRKVAFVNSVLVVGRVRNSAKRYWQWRTFASQGFYRNKAGNIQAYAATRPWDFKLATPWSHRTPVGPFDMLEADSPASIAFRRAVEDKLHFKSLADLYPMAERYGLFRYDTIPYEMRVPMRASSWEDMTVAMFGKKRTTPRLVNAVAQTDPYVVALAHQFRGLVQDYNVVSYIERNRFDDEMIDGFKPHNPNVRKLVMAIPETSRVKLLRSQLDLSDMIRISSLVSMGSRHNIDYITRRLVDTEVSSWADVYGR